MCSLENETTVELGLRDLIGYEHFANVCVLGNDYVRQIGIDWLEDIILKDFFLFKKVQLINIHENCILFVFLTEHVSFQSILQLHNTLLHQVPRQNVIIMVNKVSIVVRQYKVKHRKPLDIELLLQLWIFNQLSSIRAHFVSFPHVIDDACQLLLVKIALSTMLIRKQNTNHLLPLHHLLKNHTSVPISHIKVQRRPKVPIFPSHRNHNQEQDQNLLPVHFAQSSLQLQLQLQKANVMSKQSSKKHRHSSLIDVPFTQRTAYFKQDFQADPYRTLPSRSTFKTMIQNENLPLQNKYINQNECVKSIQEKLMNGKMGGKKNSLKKVVNGCFKEIVKGAVVASEGEGLERRIQQILERKIKKMVEGCVEGYLSKFMEEQKEYMKSLWSANERDIQQKISKIENGYDNILQTYDNFLNIVEKIKDKSLKADKYTKKTDFQTAMKKTEHQVALVQAQMQEMSRQLQLLKQVEKSVTLEQSKIKPILLKYESKDFGLDELRVVVETYNENFMQIDQKLQEIYAYFT